MHMRRTHPVSIVLNVYWLLWLQQKYTDAIIKNSNKKQELIYKHG